MGCGRRGVGLENMREKRKVPKLFPISAKVWSHAWRTRTITNSPTCLPTSFIPLPVHLLAADASSSSYCCGAPGVDTYRIPHTLLETQLPFARSRPSNPYIRTFQPKPARSLQRYPADMPPSNTPIPSAQQNGHARKRTAPVVPAIPLALSKPRPTKTQPKPESDARAGAENVTPASTPAEVPNLHEEPRPASGESDEPNVQANGSGTPEARLNGETEADMPIEALAAKPNGLASESMADQNSRPSTASTPGNVTTTNSPELARKPTERFDMRHIRTELPPTFIPAAEQHTPRSNTSSQSNRLPQLPLQPHTSHPSTSSIVFGGQDSLSSSPAPPQSAGSAYNPPSFPTFGGEPGPPFHPPHHTHHVSEPFGSRTLQAGFQQPMASWNTRPGYGQQPYHPHAHAPFRYPPREPFTPVESPRANGRLSRSGSRASSTAADVPRSAKSLQSPLVPDDLHDTRCQQSSVPHTRQFQQQMPPPPPPQLQPPDVASQIDNAEALRVHILSQYADATSADCSVTFVEEYAGSRQTYHGHKLVLTRSPTLMQLFSQDRPNSHEGITEADVPLKGRYMKYSALNEALKYVYGGPLLQLDHHRPSSSAGERTLANVERIEGALSYIAAGVWLEMPIISARGVDVAGSLLHWDTIPTALDFALDGGLHQMWAVDDGSEAAFSAASSDDSIGRPEITGAPTYDPHSTAMLQRIIDFTIHVFPPNFYLDSSAPQLETCPRLPPLPQIPGHENRSSVSDPRLSQIRFGEIPTGPSYTTTMISSILLSLPFQLLKVILEHFIFAARLGPETAASIMRQVVAERERRRTKAQQARTAGKISSGSDSQLLQNLYWEEVVEPSAQHKVGFRLARRRKGIDTPLSSGPE